MSKSGTNDRNAVFSAVFVALFIGFLEAIFTILVRTTLVFMIVRSANVPVIQDWSFAQILGVSAAVFILASNARPLASNDRPREIETP